MRPPTILVIVAAIMLLGGASAFGSETERSRAVASTAPITWAVTGSPFRLDLRRGGEHVTRLGGASAPLAYIGPEGRTVRLTKLVATRRSGRTTSYSVATEEAGRRATVAVGPTAKGFRIELRVPGASAVRLALTASKDAHFLGTGSRARTVDMQRRVVPLKVWNECRSSQPAPFFAGTGGFGAFIDSTAIGSIAFPLGAPDPIATCTLGTPLCPVGAPVAAVRVCLKADRAVVYLLSGSLQQQVTAYAKRVGLPRKPALAQLSLVQWRDRVSGPDELLADVDEMRRLGLPIGWVLLDNPWESNAAGGRCYGSLQPDPVAYPDFKGTISAIHSRGVRLMLWVSPQIERTNCPPPTYPDGWLTGNQDTFLWDLTVPAARAGFVEKLRALVALGVDGFKVDRGDEINLEPNRLGGGPGTMLQNVYPRLLAQAVADASASHGSFGTLFRAGGPGASARVSGFWGGDRPHHFGGLQTSIRQAQTAGVSGMPVWGSDIGGYSGGELSAEVFVRWAQFGALTPIFEVGGQGANATFWRFGTTTVEQFRRAATLHYELAPYLYQLAIDASRTGIPVVRPLGLTWENDRKAWSRPLEFTVGDGLLAAPVTRSANGRATVATSVYLPAGDWVDLFTGARKRGPSTFVRRSRATDFPLYVRRGAALAFNFRLPSVWSEQWGVNDLVRSNRQGWLLAPTTDAAARARDRSTTLSAKAATDGRIDVTLRAARKQQQFLVLPEKRICKVEASGKTVPRAAVGALRSRPRGWGIESSARKGVVVKIATAPARLVLRLTPCAT